MIQSSEYCRSVYSVTFHRTLSGFGATFTVLLRSDSLLANCFPNRLEMQQRRNRIDSIAVSVFADIFIELTNTETAATHNVLSPPPLRKCFGMQFF